MCAVLQGSDSMPYRDSSLPVEKRVADLLSRMTLEEKAAQMIGMWEEKKKTFIDENGNFDLKKAKESFKHGNGIGQIGRPNDTKGGLKPKEHAEHTNTIQKFFIENSRLGIPVIFHEECLHGLMAVDSTSFSQPIGLGATFNIDLVQKLFEMTAEEARVRGTHQALTPVVDVAREPRWGRVEETYGEDPFLAAQMGIAAVKGFQGDRTFKNKKHIIATLKHFAAHGQPESGCNCAPANISERILREVFLYPFKEVIQKAGVISVMPSYNEIDGVPSHANKWLLRDVLRGEWGFKGFTVSDYYAIRELNERPGFFGNYLAENGKQAAVLAIKAGVNIELPEPDCYKHIVELVKEGTIQESMLDELVAPMLEWKFRLGLFENPYVDPEIAEKVVGSDKNRELALQAAKKTITLLKNDGVAPIKAKKVKTIAVIGPNADRVMIGGYSSTPPYHITVLEGIRQRAGKSINVLYHEGCKITIGGSWFADTVTLADPAENRKSIKQAVKVAKQADIIVLAIGGNEQTSREGWMYNHMGDRASLDMVGQQNELVDAMAATGKPIIAVLFNGKPLSIKNLSEKASAIFECWYLGQESGKAIAEAIFGDYNPGGKLPISVPRSVGHVPCYYNYKPAARRGYLFDEVSPLYAFGYGLSYTNFEFCKPRLKSKIIRTNESTTVSVKVTNTGKQKGDEVVQMYIRDKISSVTRPVKELKGFKRITLEPGKSKTVTFEITPELLSFYDINMKYTVEPGEFEIMIGNSSRNEDLQRITLTVE